MYRLLTINALGAAAGAQDVVANYSSCSIDLVVVLITAAVVCVCVLVHYEVLNALSRRLATLEGRCRRRVLFGIFGVLSVHVAEIRIFGAAYVLLSILSPAFRRGARDSGPVRAQSHLFFGNDIHDGWLWRRLSDRTNSFSGGTEALTGLVLITWSASFTFLEMARFWRDR